MATGRLTTYEDTEYSGGLDAEGHLSKEWRAILYDEIKCLLLFKGRNGRPLSGLKGL